MFRVRIRSLSSLWSCLSSAQLNPRGFPRFAASERFSAIVIVGAVPLNGFWKTRPIRDARLCSGHLVMSCPLRLIFPLSVMNEPATEFNNVDLPEPLVPMMMRKSPSLSVTDTFCSAKTSLTLPGWKVLEMFVISSMSDSPSGWLVATLVHKATPDGWSNESRKDKERRDELEVVWIQAPAERDGNQESE